MAISGGAAGVAGMMLLHPHSGVTPPVSGAEFLICAAIFIVITAIIVYYVTHYDPPGWLGE